MTSKKRPDPKIEFPEYLTECTAFLNQQGYDKIALLSSMVSYMTGLKYCRHDKKVEAKDIYICLSEPENKVDPMAMGVYNANDQRVAYAPKAISATIREQYYDIRERVIILCYCTGYTTQQSAQCFYNIYRV